MAHLLVYYFIFQKPVNPRRQPSGYIVFAGEIRKQISLENPNCSFGDISKIVGTKVSKGW